MLRTTFSIVLATSIARALPAVWERAMLNGTSHGITNSSADVADKTFDYIICGGGLTGLVVASRLSEDPSVSVLVIEAGYDNHADERVNDVRTYGDAFDSELDHGIRSTPVVWQDDKGLLMVAGKTLGGSGSLNGASWTKGAASQYDLLPVLTGDKSWGWEQFNKHMLKAENFVPPKIEQITRKGAHYESAYHGYGGPIDVAFGKQMFNGTQQIALDTAETVWPGFKRNFDAATGNAAGGTIIPNMVYSDESQNRSSPFTEYAQRQVEERNNFLILTGHRVIEILWQDQSTINPSAGLIAIGVRFQSSPDSPISQAYNSREVLLAAGSLQSPQILELSGVGDASVLAEAGIPLKLDLPGVGKNMQEQTKNTVTFKSIDMDFEGTGPPSAIAFPSAHQLLGPDSAEKWYHDTKSSLNSYAAKLEAKGLIARGTAQHAHAILQSQLDNLFHEPDTSAAEAFFTIDPAKQEIGIDNWNLIVLSRGTTHVKSKNPWDHPVVNPSYFLHALDLAFQVAVNKASRKLFNTAPLKNFTVEELSPGIHVLPEASEDAAWESWVKANFTSVWHYVATLSMMKRELGGVVDERLKVYGIGNVRAVDASVVPVQLSAHLSSSLFGVAEKAAGMVKEDWEGK